MDAKWWNLSLCSLTIAQALGAVRLIDESLARLGVLARASLEESLAVTMLILGCCVLTAISLLLGLQNVPTKGTYHEED